MDQIFRFRILPALIIVAALALGLRFSHAMTEIKKVQSDPKAQESLAAIDTAAGENSEKKPDASATAPPMPEQPPKDQGTEKAEASDQPTQKPEVEAPTLGKPPAQGAWRGAEDVDDEYADVKMELFEDLSKRRKDLEAREKELAMREALLKAAQTELEQKYKELTSIKTDIESLLKQQTAEENKRITSLVKIYEGMKAKDAARIFDSLDMDVLIQVLSTMSERKSAPIIAAMSPEKARNVTILLAEQNKLPSLPPLEDAGMQP
jgi:flagellar motility protein MotE (MotC chaperone)